MKTRKEIEAFFESKGFHVISTSYCGIEDYTAMKGAVNVKLVKKENSEGLKSIEFFTNISETACKLGNAAVKEFLAKGKDINKLGHYIEVFERVNSLMIELGI